MRLGITGWLGACCAMILLMVAIGGVTRLTNSGLSITEWRPVTGVIPPIGNEAWVKEKEKYEQTPEYRYITSGISLHDFKKIYLIEYAHRLLGRILGMLFLVPMIFFLLKREINGSLAIKLLFVAILGLLQGVVGWLMVKSGLVDVPHVSHYRLACHLLLTILLFSLLWQSFLDSAGVCLRHEVTSSRLALAIATVVFIALQMVIGALVAGLNAGMIFNTFPLMDGELIPNQLFYADTWRNKFLEDRLVVQFLHRILAVCVVIFSAAVAVLIRRPASFLLLFCVILQFTLGVITLIKVVPVHLASMHQIFGFVVLALGLYVVFSSKSSPLPGDGRTTIS